MATKRTGVLATATEKSAAASFKPVEDDAMLDGMIDQVNKTTAHAIAEIDKALAFVAESNKRIEQMENDRLAGSHAPLAGGRR